MQKEMLYINALKLTEEDGDNSVPLKIVHGSFFHEDISFVDEYDCTPA